MTFNATSYFAGVGTVLATLTLGFGGGVLMSGGFGDKAPREPNKVERQMADRAKPEAPPVIAATPVVPAIPKNEAIAATPPAAAAPPEPLKQPEPSPTAPPVPQVQPQPQPQVTTQIAPPPAAAVGRDRPVALVHPAIREHDRKQDLQRQTAEKRKAERERQRAERRREREMRDALRQQQREAQQASTQRSRGIEVDDEDRDERPVFGWRGREEFARPGDFPRPRLFRFFNQDD